jgi:hypothetical protein
VIALALCFLLTGNLGANVQGTLHLSFFTMPSVYLERYVALVSDRVAALVLGSGTLAAVRAAGVGATAAVALAVLACVVAATLVGRRGLVQTILAAAYLYLASLFLSTMGRLVFAVLPLASFPTRYTIPSSAMLLLVIALDGLPGGRPRRGAILVATAILAWSLGSRIGVAPFLDQRWPQYAALLDQKLRAGSTAPLTVPLNPRWTPLVIDGRALAPQPPLPATHPIAALDRDRPFRQTFTSQCDGLDGIVLHLAAGTSASRGPIALSLVDEQQRTVATSSVPRGELLQDAPQPFYFPPITGSAGRRYTIVLQASGTDPAHPIMVLGATRDPYPDGRAIVEGATPDLDASFAYSCASTWTASR